MKPAEWASVANKNYPAHEDVTPWFSGKLRPTKIGAYERIFADGKWYNHWDGKKWRVRPEGYVYPQNVQVGGYVAWRGLTEKAYKERVVLIKRVNESPIGL